MARSSTSFNGFSTSGSSPRLLGPLGPMAVACSQGNQSLGEQLQTLCREGQLDRAMHILLRMDQLGLVLSHDNLCSLLKACSKKRALAHVKQVHNYISKANLHLKGFLGDYLAAALAKCGALEDACMLFFSLPSRTVYSWTAMISAYVDYGVPQEALRMYQLLQEDGVEPDLHTFASLFKACGSICDLDEARKLHAAAQRKGFISDVFVGSNLLTTYAKCGCIGEAETVFEGLSQHDVVSWTAMLSAYIEHNQFKNALKLYRQMQQEGMHPDQRAFVMTLQACLALVNDEVMNGEEQTCKLMSIKIAQGLHSDACRRGYSSDVFVGSALVSVYAKCGSVAEVENVFTGLSHHDAVSWNVMLSAYVEQGQPERALQLYVQMQVDVVSSNQQTYMIVLQACVALMDKSTISTTEEEVYKAVPLKIGEALHDDTARKGHTFDAFVGSSLINMYGKCDSINKAESVFDGLSSHDTVLWNAMLSAYLEQGEAEKVLWLYRQMQEEDACPNKQTYMIIIQACGTLIDRQEVSEGQLSIALEVGQALHADARRKGFALDAFVGSTLVTMHAKCRHIEEAERVFDELSQHDLVSWNVMLSAYANQGQEKTSLRLYRQLQEEGMVPNSHTFVIVLQACIALVDRESMSKVGCMEVCKELQADAWRKGYGSDVSVCTTLVNVHGKHGSIKDAEYVFSGLSVSNSLVWNAMLSAYADHCQGESVLKLYKQMQEMHMFLDAVTFLCALQACSKAGRLEICWQVHFNIVYAGYDLNPFLATTLVHAYGGCACMVDAKAHFDVLPQPAVESWNACIDGYAREGNGIASMQMFEQMQLAGCMPDVVTFLSLICACCHVGLIAKGVEFFLSMIRNYGLTPDLRHRAALIDLLGRAGDFRWMERIIRGVPTQGALEVWFSLLTVCRTHANVELGRQAFDHVVRLKPKEAVAYVLMANIYADAGLQEYVNDVVTLRQKAGAGGESGDEKEQVDDSSFLLSHEEPQESHLDGLFQGMRESVNKGVDAPNNDQ